MIDSALLRIEDIDQSFLPGGQFDPSDTKHVELVVEKYRREGGIDCFFTDVHFDGLVIQISRNKEAEQELESCIELFSLGGYKPALHRLEPLLDKYPYHIDLLFNCGMAFREIGEPRKSIDLLTRATTLKSDHVHAWVALAVSHQSARELDKATEAAKTAYELKDSDPYVLRTYGSLLEANGDVESATTILEQAIRLMPDDSQSHLILGKIKASSDPGAAKRHFLKVTDSVPGSTLSEIAENSLRKL